MAGLIVRLAFGLLYWVDKPLTHDEREYLALARSVAAGRGFVYDATHDTGTAQQFGRAPGIRCSWRSSAPDRAGTTPRRRA